MSALAIPEGATIVHTFKQSFVDVPIDAEKGNAIATTQFLDAAESLTTMFGRLLMHPYASMHWEELCV